MEAGPNRQFPVVCSHPVALGCCAQWSANDSWTSQGANFTRETFHLEISLVCPAATLGSFRCSPDHTGVLWWAGTQTHTSGSRQHPRLQIHYTGSWETCAHGTIGATKGCQTIPTRPQLCTSRNSCCNTSSATPWADWNTCHITRWKGIIWPTLCRQYQFTGARNQTWLESLHWTSQ